MSFDNKQFEKNISDTIQSLEKLEKQLSEIPSDYKSINNVSASLKNLDQATLALNKDTGTVQLSFDSMSVAAVTAIAKVTNAAMNAGATLMKYLNKPLQQIISGGQNRALNIENAKFQLKGLGVEWESISDSINYGVKDTAYGLDAAARVAAQLVASGVDYFDKWDESLQDYNNDMKDALRGISGVAAMTNSSYEEIGSIFTTVAGQGKLMTMQLRQLEARGLNAAASIGEQLGVTEAQIRDMVTRGQIDFATFSKAMDDAFGEHAKEANQTYAGSLSNVKAALSRIGAEFASPWFDNLRKINVSLIGALNTVKSSSTGIVDLWNRGLYAITNALTKFLENEDTLKAVENTITAIYRIIRPIRNGIQEMINKHFPKVKDISKVLLDISEKLKLSEKAENTLRIVTRDIIDAFLLLKDIGTGLFSMLVGGIRAFLEGLGFSVDGSEEIAATFYKIIEIAKVLWEYVSKFLKEKISDYAKKFGQAISKIKWSDVINALSIIFNLFIAIAPVAINLFASLINGIAKFAPAVAKAVLKIAMTLEAFFDAIVSTFQTIWDNVANFFLGLAALIDAVVDAVKSFINDTIDGVKKLVGLVPDKKTVNIEYKTSTSNTDDAGTSNINPDNINQVGMNSDLASASLDKWSKKAGTVIVKNNEINKLSNEAQRNLELVDAALQESMVSYEEYEDAATVSWLSISKASEKSNEDTRSSLTKIGDAIATLIYDLKNQNGDIGQDITNVFSTVTEGIVTAINSMIDAVSDLEIPWGKVLGIGTLLLIIGSIPATLLEVGTSIASLGIGKGLSMVLDSASSVLYAVGANLWKIILAIAVLAIIPADRVENATKNLLILARGIANLSKALSSIFFAMSALYAAMAADNFVRWLRNEQQRSLFGSMATFFKDIGKAVMSIAISAFILSAAIYMCRDATGKIDTQALKQMMIGLVASVAVIGLMFVLVQKATKTTSASASKTFDFKVLDLKISGLAVELLSLALVLGVLLKSCKEIGEMSGPDFWGTIGTMLILLAAVGVFLFSITKVTKDLEQLAADPNVSDKKLAEIGSIISSLFNPLMKVILVTAALVMAVGAATSKLEGAGQIGAAIAIFSVAMTAITAMVGLLTNGMSKLISANKTMSQKGVDAIKNLGMSITGVMSSISLLIISIAASTKILSDALAQSTGPGALIAIMLVVLSMLVFITVMMTHMTDMARLMSAGKTNGTALAKMINSLSIILGAIAGLVLVMAISAKMIGSKSELDALIFLMVGAFAGIALVIYAMVELAKSFKSQTGTINALSGMFKSMALLILSMSAMMLVIGLVDWDWNALGGLLIVLGVLTIVFVGLGLLLKATEKISPAQITSIGFIIGAVALMVVAIAALALVLSLIDYSKITDEAMGFIGLIFVLTLVAMALAAYMTNVVSNSQNAAAAVVALGMMALIFVSIGVMAVLMAKAGEMLSTIDTNILMGLAIFFGVIILAIAIVSVVLASNAASAESVVALAMMAVIFLSIGIMAVMIAAAAQMMDGVSADTIDKLTTMMIICGVVAVLAAIISGTIGANPTAIGSMGAFSVIIISLGSLALLMATALSIISKLAWPDFGRALAMMGATIGLVVVLAFLFMAFSAPLIAAFGVGIAVVAIMDVFALLLAAGIAALAGAMMRCANVVETVNSIDWSTALSNVMTMTTFMLNLVEVMSAGVIAGTLGLIAGGTLIVAAGFLIVVCELMDVAAAVALKALEKIQLAVLGWNDIQYAMKHMGEQTSVEFIDGMIIGLKESYAMLQETTAEGAKMVEDTMKDELGIHSPSTFMIWIGKMLIQGLSNGIAENTPAAANTAEQSASKVGDAYDVTMGKSVEANKETIAGYTDNINEEAPNAEEAAGTMAEDTMNEMNSKTGEGMDNLNGTFQGGWIGMLSAVADKIKEWITNVKDWFSNLWDGISGGKDFDMDMTSTMSTVIENVGSGTDAIGLTGSDSDLTKTLEDIIGDNSILGTGRNPNSGMNGWTDEDIDNYTEAVDLLDQMKKMYEETAGGQYGDLAKEQLMQNIIEQQALVDELKAVGDSHATVDDDSPPFDLGGMGGGLGGDGALTSDMADEIYGGSGTGSGIGDSGAPGGSTMINSNNNYTFVQNNYSPTPLSRKDIYIQTQRQFDSWTVWQGSGS